MKNLKNRIKNGVIIPAVAVSITFPALTGFADVCCDQNIRSEIRTLSLEQFVYSSVDSGFRARYFSDIERLSGDYYISEPVMELIRGLDLDALERAVTDVGWDSVEASREGIDRHTDSHTDVSDGEGTHRDRHYNSHDKDAASLEDFMWEKLLKEYTGTVVNPGLYMNSLSKSSGNN